MSATHPRMTSRRQVHRATRRRRPRRTRVAVVHGGAVVAHALFAVLVEPVPGLHTDVRTPFWTGRPARPTSGRARSRRGTRRSCGTREGGGSPVRSDGRRRSGTTSRQDRTVFCQESRRADMTTLEVTGHADEMMSTRPPCAPRTA